MSCAVVSVVTVLWFASPALAGNWGENWGEMVCEVLAAPIPTMGLLGGRCQVVDMNCDVAHFGILGAEVRILEVPGL